MKSKKPPKINTSEGLFPDKRYNRYIFFIMFWGVICILLLINVKSIKMKDILVVAKLKEGNFEKFMGFMQSEQGMNERRKIADLSKTLGTVSPDKTAVMFKIAVHDEDALSSFLDGSNPVSKPIFEEVMVSYEIFKLNKV
tara:strand:+ start:869 stop:1288 length:420 start_codon:yes stop_codon:yes gene_type:complete